MFQPRMGPRWSGVRTERCDLFDRMGSGVGNVSVGCSVRRIYLDRLVASMVYLHILGRIHIG